jgi:UDP-glucose 4-epimerase
MRAAVTGGAGFIGSHLVDALVARGDDVVVVDDLSTGRRDRVPDGAALLVHDIRTPFSVEADVVFHLAAQADVGTSMERPGFDAEVNVAGTVNTLEAARACGAEVVFSSTGGAIYGEVSGAPATEETPRRPVSAYGIAKLCAEEYVTGWNRIHGTDHTVLRFANVYGPRQSAALEGGVVSIFMERLRGGDETLVFGDGEQTRDYVYVADVVEAALAAVGRGGVYNVGTGTETSVNGLHRLCAEIAGSDHAPTHVAARPGDARRSVLDSSLAARELGWHARTSLEAGLRTTWETPA